MIGRSGARGGGRNDVSLFTNIFKGVILWGGGRFSILNLYDWSLVRHNFVLNDQNNHSKF